MSLRDPHDVGGMRTVVLGPFTGRQIVCRSPEEYLRVIEWKRWVEGRRQAHREERERLKREADQPWRTEGRAELVRVR